MTSSAAAPATFDPLGPLPTGPTTTVLEASAGTGKTHTIATLVTRYIAEDVTTVDRLLVVTFSRNATRELRDRVRESLVRTRDALAGAATAVAPALDADPLAVWLADAPPEEVADRRRRLDRAVADFDSATVVTTHGFCQQALLALGTAAVHDRGAELVEDVTGLVDDVVSDEFLRRWSQEQTPPLGVGLVRELGAIAASDPGTPLDPVGAEGEAGLRAEVTASLRDELARRTRMLGLFTYDDLVTSLARAVTDPATRGPARSRLRARYDVVLADEFQDTDALQWQILRETFVGHATVVLIGDPKQAIYAFRGADVQSYLQARDAADDVRTLGTSWRSSAALLRGLEHVFRGAALGDPEIVVHPVRSAHPDSVVQGAGPPVRLRVVPRRDGRRLPTVGPIRQRIAADAAAQVVALLGSGATIRPRGAADPRPLQPADVAVLVRKHDQAELVREALRHVGVPAVSTGGAGVFASDAAREWLVLLEALEQPQRRSRTSRLALGPLLAVDAVTLAEDDAVRDVLRDDLGRWAAVLGARGVAALWEAVSREGRVEQRLLARTDGERLVTDLRHLAQELDRVAVAERLGLSRLVTWLRRHVADGVVGRSEHARKLESDAAAVQISTAHTAKGLEYPVVLVPFAWDHFVRDADDVVSAVHHGPGRERRRDVGGPTGPDWPSHLAEHRRADLDDELRLTYVAATRPESHLVLWWAPTRNTVSSPLHRLLFRPEHDPEPPASIEVPAPERVVEHLGTLAAASDGTLVVEELGTGGAGGWEPAPPPVPALDRRRLDRDLQAAWRRTSYSALTADAHHDAGLEPTSEAEVGTTDDETEVVALAADVPLVPDAPLSPWDAVPGGRHLGTVVHRVLEELLDPADDEALTMLCHAYAARARAEPDVLATAVRAVVATPLGTLADDLTWAGTRARDRLPELDFELPLAGGDRPGRTPAALGDLAALWRRHVPDGPMAPYADALTTLDPPALQGYLTGSIDAVLRVGEAATPRYVVVDHKTNRLAPPETPLTAWHYRPDALAEAMIDAHYPLQALLYQVALHRFLRWRQPGYDPGVHLGGTLYLFLRGMVGADAPAGSGVFSWATPASLVVAASDALAGRAS